LRDGRYKPAFFVAAFCEEEITDILERVLSGDADMIDQPLAGLDQRKTAFANAAPPYGSF
jgi:hypothetical protein